MEQHSQINLTQQEVGSEGRILTDQNITSNQTLKNKTTKKYILPPLAGVSPNKSLAGLSPNKNLGSTNQTSFQRMNSIDPLIGQTRAKMRKLSIDDDLSDDYKLANYETSKQFFKHQGYFKKQIVKSKTVYHQTNCCDSNLEFLNEYHSTGIYLYFQLLKRFLFLLLICSCLSGVQLYNNYAGTKLSTYTKSFSTTLAYFSLGNNDGNTITNMYIQCGLATVQVIALVVFYIQWRVASNQIIKQYLQNPTIIEPQRYALTVSGIDYSNSPQTLAYRFQKYLKELGYNVYQCEVILDYDNNFNDYLKLQKLMEQIQEETHLEKQGKGCRQKIEEKITKKDQLKKQIQQYNKPLKPLFIIIHFQTKLDKAKFINSYKYTNKLNDCCSALSRFCCCFKPRQSQLFEDQLVLLQNQMIGRPDDIYWENIDASCGSRLWRTTLGIFIILASLIITSTIIACCILYASGASSCSEYIPSSTLSTVLGNQNLLYCFCEQNIFSTDTSIVAACGTVNRTVLINNALLIVSSIASALSNIVLGIIVELVISFMKPNSRSKQYQSNCVIIIIATLINSCFLPLVLNASIFGYTPNAYLRIFNFINFTNVKIVSDFNSEWYVFISPYYINLFLVAIAMPWINLFKCMIVNSIRRCMIKKKIGQILQKTSDKMIIGYKFDVASQNALIIVNTLICFTYSTSLPLLPILHFFGICSLYITNRICLLRYSRRVSLDQQLNNIIIHIIPVIIILNICFSIWALTSDTLFPVDYFKNTSFQFDILGSTQFKRAFYFLPLIACLAVVVVFLIIDYILIRLCALCCKNNAIFPQNTDRRSFFSYKCKGSNILTSYKFSKNPDYKHVFSTVDSMLRKKYNKS